MELDLKTGLIAVLFIAFSIFFAKWWIESDSHKKDNKQLKADIANIQHERDSLRDERNKIDSQIDSLNIELAKTKAVIVKLDEQLLYNQRDLQTAKDKLNVLQGGLNQTRKKIQELKKNPIKRTGSSLINSIKEKTK